MLGVDVKIGLAINRLGLRDFMTTLAQAEASLSHVKLGGVQRIEDVLAEDNGEPLHRRLEQTLAEALQEIASRVGIGLVKRFPVSLELAGVILLMAMFGAVILARRQIELTEDEKRAAAGMRRLGHHDEGPPPAGGGT